MLGLPAHHLNLSWVLKTSPRCSRLWAAGQKSMHPALPLLRPVPALLLPSSSSSSHLLLQTAPTQRVLGNKRRHRPLQTMQQQRPQRKRLRGSKTYWWRLGRSLLLQVPGAPQPVEVAMLLLLGRLSQLQICRAAGSQQAAEGSPGVVAGVVAGGRQRQQQALVQVLGAAVTLVVSGRQDTLCCLRRQQLC